MNGKSGLGSILLILGITLCTPLPGLAQGSQAGDSGLGVKLSLSAIEQFEADVGDSKMDVSRYQVKADIDLKKNRKMILNLSASYKVSDYNFSGPPADPWSDPWGEITSTDVGLSLILPGSGRWSYFLASTLDGSREKGADKGDGLVYGIIASAAYAKRLDRRLGFGVGVFEGLEETKIFPYATVSWRLKENLTLQNPLSAGPASPAGLELVYDVSENWQIGAGGAYRSFRFRLDKEGVAPDGIGEITGVPAWVRASWQASPKLGLGFYTGAILAGEAAIKDNAGRNLQSRHFNPAPLAAVILEWAL